MKVTEDPWTRGMVADAGPFSHGAVVGAAEQILRGIGSKYEPQTYTAEEKEWARAILSGTSFLRWHDRRKDQA